MSKLNLKKRSLEITIEMSYGKTSQFPHKKHALSSHRLYSSPKIYLFHMLISVQYHK